METLKDRAYIEALLLQTYEVKLPARLDIVPAGPVDRVSVGILERLHPIVLGDHQPEKVYGDGNCLYRAVSRLLYGDEGHHLLIRLLSCIEMVTNPLFYDNSSRNYKDLIQDDRVVLSR